MVTTHALTSGNALPAPLVVDVVDVDWDAGDSRRAEVVATDMTGTPLLLIDYEGANLSVNWTSNHRYRISRCSVMAGNRRFACKLAPSTKTRIDAIGPLAGVTEILVIGDTHIGRTTHPGTGKEIDPLSAFCWAVNYGINQDVSAVVHVGDIFHENATDPQRQLVEAEGIERLLKADIPFHYVTGNHGAEQRNKLFTERSESAIGNLDTSGTAISADVRVFGINHYPDGEIPTEALTFPDSFEESMSVLVLHQTLSQISGSSPLSVDVGRILRASPSQFDIILSGHHHDAVRTQWRNTPVLYTGASDRMSTNADPVDGVGWILSCGNETVACSRFEIPKDRTQPAIRD